MDLQLHSFYKTHINRPMSVDLGSNPMEWAASPLGQLDSKTNGQCYVHTLPAGQERAKYCWRVVSAEWSKEDDLLTYFRAYNLGGSMLPFATFGVTYGSLKSQIDGGFKYPPEALNKYYVPAQNNFVTPEAGGYTVVVLDYNWPTEGMSFGMYKQGDQHQNLTISFRLFRTGKNYPKD